MTQPDPLPPGKAREIARRAIIYGQSHDLRGLEDLKPEALALDLDAKYREVLVQLIDSGIRCAEVWRGFDRGMKLMQDLRNDYREPHPVRRCESGWMLDCETGPDGQPVYSCPLPACECAGSDFPEEPGAW